MTASFVIAVDCRPLIDPRISGVSVYSYAMIEALQTMPGVSLQFFYQSKTRAPHLHERFPSIEHHAVSSFHFHLRSLLGPPPLPKDYFRSSPDLIWLPDRRPFYRSPLPVVMTVHDHVPRHCRSSLSWKAKLWHAAFPLKKLLKPISGVLCPSFSVEQELPRDIPRRVTYAGVTPVRPTAPTVKIPKEFSLFLAPLDPRKGIQSFLDLARRFPKQRFVWAGVKAKDPRFARLKLEVPNNVILLGEISEGEKWWLYRHARVFLALSDYEGFDLPVLEAMHARCPVILSDIPVHRELFKGGSFVRSQADLEREFLRTEWPPLRARGTYSWTAAAQEALLFFRRVVENKDR